MKTKIKGFFLLFLAIAAVGCGQDKKEDQENDSASGADMEKEQAFQQFSNEEAENAVIYEANIRQYSPEGTFAEFTKDIPKLKELGVKILWLMPIYPISEKNRKATGDKLVSEIEDPAEREKYLGSYYAIADYTAVNPEFGTKEDLDELIQTAHDNGIYVILDWVANHTGWDHPWTEEHKDFYTLVDGEITDPINEGTGESWGWDDVADLNYDNKELWKAMTDQMKYWVENHDVDGFRCDVAGEVPTEFWNYAIPKLEEKRSLFMLAESEEKSLFIDAFDMGYNWEGHHLMNELAKGKIPVQRWDEYMQKIDTTYQEDDYLMNFITNHDENSWNGTVEERMGDAKDAMLAFSYAIPGMPLIYSGQEYDMNHRLKFFEKDSIPKKAGKTFELMVKLGELKNNQVALNGAANAAEYVRLGTSEPSIYAFKREKDGEEVYFIANLSGESVAFEVSDIPEGIYDDMTREATAMEFKAGKNHVFPAWGWRFLKKREN